MKKFLLKLLLTIFLFSTNIYAAIGPEKNGLSLTSPDDKITATFYLDDNSNLNYNVYLNNNLILEHCKLSVTINKITIGKNAKILNSFVKEVDETYKVDFGKASNVRNNYREGIISLKSDNILYDIIFRVYNDGVAFRYNYPKQSTLNSIKITEEKSSFKFSKDHKVYAMRLSKIITPTGYIAYLYENHYNKMNLSAIYKNANIGMPLLIDGDNFFAAITEAALKDYTGISLKKDKTQDYTLVTTFNRGKSTNNVNVNANTPFVSPWRVVMIGEKLSTLVESNLILNLNDKTGIKDTSWITPGKSVWPWWSDNTVKDVDFKGGINTATYKYYIDFASKHNLPYLIIDAGWYCPEIVAWIAPLNQDATKVTAKDLNLDEVIKYGKEKNVKVILWVHGATLFKQLDEVLETYNKWGVAGIKVDDWGREDQEWVNFWWEVAEKAANYKMVVDFHGTYKPTGLRKVYPNVLTREAIAGLEQPKLKCNLKHEVTIPFTRMLVGPMDFTPGAVASEWFSGNRPRVAGTAAHQLAMYVVYESPLQMLVDYPSAYENNNEALSFLEVVPTVWDETLLLDGVIGDYIIMARKSGVNWFIGAMTDKETKQLNINLNFLSGGEYICDIYTDSRSTTNDPAIVEHKAIPVKKGDTLPINLISGGGFAAYIHSCKGECS
jgi:alpha-glucosidase